MPAWKLPRKRKKAYIALYGRERYRMAREAAAGENLFVSCDFGVSPGVIMVADIKANGTVKLIGSQRTMGESRALAEFIASMPRREYTLITDRQEGKSYYPPMRVNPWEEVLKNLPDLEKQLREHTFSFDIAPRRSYDDSNLTYRGRVVAYNGLYQRVMGLASQIKALRFAEQKDEAQALQEQLVNLIEREAVRDPESDSKILVDRQLVAIEDDLLGEIWLTYSNGKLDHTVLPGGVEVRTWLISVDPPHLFRTMVVGGEHDGHVRTYGTLADAERGHQEVIELIFKA